mgnify:FL=1
MIYLINKYYANIKKIIRENIGFFIIWFVVILLFFIDTPYLIYTPGSYIDLGTRIDADTDNKTSGTFGMAYVSVVKASPIFIGISYLNKNWDLISKDKVKYDDETLKDAEKRDKISMEEAVSNAKIAAFKEASGTYNIDDVHHIITYLDSNDTELKLFDEIKSVDGITINNLEDIRNVVATKKSGTKMNIEVMRNKKLITVSSSVYEIDGRKILGISLTDVYDVTTNPEVEIKIKSNESGPSGGLMMSLSIYNSLVSKDISKCKKIIGTGTIDVNGNVGEIGGVKYKLIGAVKNKADVFLCPKENYEEAVKVAKDNNYGIKIVAVSTLKEAIEELENL